MKHDDKDDLFKHHVVKKSSAKATTTPKATEVAPAVAAKTPPVANETPMYTRPYLEDPIFLQPDDGEVSLLHPDLSHTDDDHKMDESHDLVGDPDLDFDDSEAN